MVEAHPHIGALYGGRDGFLLTLQVGFMAVQQARPAGSLAALVN
jgi:hypothetical protein